MGSLRDFYHRHFLWLELLFALLAACLFAALVEMAWDRAAFQAFLKGSRQSLYSTVASLASSLLGFVIAVVPIVLGFGQMGRMRIVRMSGHYPEVFRIFFQAMYWLSLAVIGAIAGILFDTDDCPHVVVTYLMAFLLFAVVARVLRCIWILRRITTIALQDSGSGPPAATSS